MRKFGYGLLWFLALSIGILILGGMIVAGIAGWNNPANGVAAGQVAGQAFGEKYGGIIFTGSLIVAVIGSVLGWLPGTNENDINHGGQE